MRPVGSVLPKREVSGELGARRAWMFAQGRGWRWTGLDMTPLLPIAIFQDSRCVWDPGVVPPSGWNRATPNNRWLKYSVRCHSNSGVPV